MPKQHIDNVRLEWSSREQPLISDEPLGGKTGRPSLRIKELVLPVPSKDHIKTTEPANRLIHGDNLLVIKALLRAGLGESAELIYIDPPFLSKTDYTHKTTIGNETITQKAYGDRWSRQEYLDMLAPRLRLIHELLTKTGVIFVHCDWRASGLIRILLDEIFGHENFLNEIIWHYGGRGAKATSGQFARNHDTIFIYGKTPKSKLKKIYTEDLLTETQARAKGFRKDADGRFFKTAPRGDYTDKSIERLEKEGRIHRTTGGKVRIKYFLETRNGFIVEQRPVGDVWDDIADAMHSPLKERTGYGTQKPVALLKRIIECATEAGDRVCDFFGGSGTTAVAAAELGRKWISVEAGPIGIHIAKQRLADISKETFTVECLEVASSEVAAPLPSTRSHRLASDEARLTIKKPKIKESKDNTYRVEISLKSYSPDKEAIANIPKGLLKNPLLLINSWAIDFDYDSKVFKNMWRSSRGAGKDAGVIEVIASLTLTQPPTRICVRAVDVMGVESEKRLLVHRLGPLYISFLSLLVFSLLIFSLVFFSLSARAVPLIEEGPAAYTITVFAGQSDKGHRDGRSKAALFNWPTSIVIDKDGALIVADYGNNTLRKIKKRRVVTINSAVATGAGKGGYKDGSIKDALFRGPNNIAIDKEGNIFIADADNYRIRKITPAGIVSTVAGGKIGYRDGPAHKARFGYPTGVAVDDDGNLFVADRRTHH